MPELKKVVIRATLRILRPFVRLLLRYEVSHSEFVELAKRAYVDVAYRHFSIPNRKKTYSRVAVITGLSRKEVVRLTQLGEEEDPKTKGPLNRAIRVTSGWLTDPDFLREGSNEPRDLPLRGEAFSFEDLVARYSGDITARAVLDELVRVRAVEKIDNQTVRLTAHGYIPQKDDSEFLEIMSSSVEDLFETCLHNLTHEKNQARFQRRVTYHDLPESAIEEFKQFSHDKSVALIMEFDRWLAEKKQSKEAKPGEKTGRVGTGIYYYQRIDDTEESNNDRG